MPNSSSFWVMRILSSTEKETDSPCVPSRRVVSNVEIFIKHLTSAKEAGCQPAACCQPALLSYFLGNADFLLFLEERHHFAQLAAHFFDRLIARFLAHGQKFVAAALVFG